MKIIKFLIYVLLVSFMSTSAFAVEYEDTLENEVMLVLTGEVKTKDGSFIKNRRSKVNRKKTRDFLTDTLVGLGYVPKEQAYSQRSGGTNLYATLNATNGSDEYIVLGAHFDSVRNSGANDNASGVAIVMAIAKQLREETIRSKNIIFVFLDEEEKGLVGASHFARLLLKEKLNVNSVHTIDQMGWDKDGDKAIELEAAPDKLYEIYQYVNTSMGFNIKLHRTNVTSTDHHAFRKKGFLAVGLTEEYKNRDTTPCYHKSCDTYETINFEYLIHSRVFWGEVIKYMIQ